MEALNNSSIIFLSSHHILFYMDTRDLIQIIAGVKPSFSPAQVCDYTMFFENPGSLPEDKISEISDDLYSVMGDMSTKDPEFAHSLKLAIAETIKSTESLEDSAQAKYLPGCLFETSTYAQTVRDYFKVHVKNKILEELNRKPFPNSNTEFKFPRLDITGWSGLKVDANPKLVYHPYFVESRTESYSYGYDLITGVEYTNLDISSLAKAKEYAQDSALLTGCEICNPITVADNIFLCPIVKVNASLELTDSLDVNVVREAEYKSSFFAKIINSEQWLVNIDSKIDATCFFYPDSREISAVLFGEESKMHLNFQSGKVIEPKKEILQGCTILSWTAGAGMGLIPPVISLLGYSSLIGLLAIPAGIAFGVAGQSFSKKCVKSEKKKLCKAISDEWHKGDRIIPI